MSTVIVNTLTGTTTAGSISVTGEGNSTTTNLQQGLAKVWVHMHYSGGTPTTQDSLNNASNTDSGTGNVNFNYTNNMASASYAPSGSNNTNRSRMGMYGDLYTSYINVLPTANHANSHALVDDNISILLTGDLA